MAGQSDKERKKRSPRLTLTAGFLPNLAMVNHHQAGLCQ
jgi:hypothetical protein